VNGYYAASAHAALPASSPKSDISPRDRVQADGHCRDDAVPGSLGRLRQWLRPSMKCVGQLPPVASTTTGSAFVVFMMVAVFGVEPMHNL